MASSTTLGAKGIALIIICIVLFIFSIISIFIFLVLKKRWRRQSNQEIELKELATVQNTAEERKSDEWRRLERRKKFFEAQERERQKKKKAKEDKEKGRVGMGKREDGKDGFGRTVDGFGKVQLPQRAKVDWKLWDQGEGTQSQGLSQGPSQGS
jgi:type II secretory pathway component PulK